MRVPERIAITGSSGLIGTALVGHLKSEGHTVQRLVRRAPVAVDEVTWDPHTGYVDLSALEGVDAIIHLAGAPVDDKRWSKKFSGNRAVIESDRVGDGFLAAVCREWEAAADLAGGVRTVKLRTGLVLDPTGGALGKMLPLFRLGFGGKLGSGKQWWSWITLHDVVRAIDFALVEDISGPVNLTAPNPVTNQEFTSALARALHRPAVFPAPAFALKAVLGGFSGEVLGSKRVIPQALLDAGFTWDYPHLSDALKVLVEG